MPKIKLTKRAVETCQPGERDTILWDTALSGFGCKITASGKRAYFLYYRTKNGNQRRPKIGSHGELTAEQAREIAKTWLARVAAGGDPSREWRDARNAPTMADLCRRFLEEHSRERNKPSTTKNYQRIIEQLIMPALGARKVADVTRIDVERLHRQNRDTPYQANRALAVISRMMNLAERWGMRPDGTNPVRHVERFKEDKRDRYLSSEELARLGDELANSDTTAAETSYVIAAIRLLVFTGCRLSEILTLQWSWVDFDRCCLELPDSKTGRKVVHLNEAALEVLSSVPKRDGNPYVIVGARIGGHLVNLEKPWRRIRLRADLKDVRIHDLRHTFASIAVGLGEGLPMIGKMLGHTQAATTHRYAHLAADPVKSANEKVGARLSSLMGGRTGELVELRPKQIPEDRQHPLTRSQKR